MDPQTTQTPTYELERLLSHVNTWDPLQITAEMMGRIDTLMVDTFLLGDEWQAASQELKQIHGDINELRSKFKEVLSAFLERKINSFKTIEIEGKGPDSNTLSPAQMKVLRENLEKNIQLNEEQQEAYKEWYQRVKKRWFAQLEDAAQKQIETSTVFNKYTPLEKTGIASAVGEGARLLQHEPKVSVGTKQAQDILKRMQTFDAYRSIVSQLPPEIQTDPSLFTQMTQLLDSHKKTIEGLPFEGISKGIAEDAFLRSWVDSQLPNLIARVDPNLRKPFLEDVGQEANILVGETKGVQSILTHPDRLKSTTHGLFVLDLSDVVIQNKHLSSSGLYQELRTFFLKRKMPLDTTQIEGMFSDGLRYTNLREFPQITFRPPQSFSISSPGGTTQPYASSFGQTVGRGMSGASRASSLLSALPKIFGSKAGAGTAARFIPLPILAFLLIFVLLPLFGITFLADPVSTMSNVSITMTTFITALTPGEQGGPEGELLPGDPGYDGTGDSSNPGVVMGKDGTPPPSELTECPVIGGGSITQLPGGDYSHSPTAIYPCSTDLCVYAFDIGGGGLSVVATHDGTVDSYRDGCSPGGCTGYGNFVKLKGTKNGVAYYTIYAHLLEVDATVINHAASGEGIDAGTVIGITDNTGSSSGPHLHYGYSGPDKAGFVLPDGCAGY